MYYNASRETAFLEDFLWSGDELKRYLLNRNSNEKRLRINKIFIIFLFIRKFVFLHLSHHSKLRDRCLGLRCNFFCFILSFTLCCCSLCFQHIHTCISLFSCLDDLITIDGARSKEINNCLNPQCRKLWFDVVKGAPMLLMRRKPRTPNVEGNS